VGKVGKLSLNRKELIELIDSIEAGGGDATDLRRELKALEPEAKETKAAPRKRRYFRDEGEETVEDRLARRVGYLFPAGITPELVSRIIEADGSHSLKDLSAMCKEHGLSLSGDKKELAAKLIANGNL